MHGEDVRQGAVVNFRPDVSVRQRVDQLHIYADAIAHFLDTSFQDESDAELLCDLHQIFGGAFVALRRSARDHFQVIDLGQAREDFILNAVSEIRIRLIFAPIVEWQHGDRFVARDRRQTGGPRCRVAAEKEQPEREQAGGDDNKYPGTTSRPRCRRCVRLLRPLEPLRRELERPCDHERDRKTDNDREHGQAHRPVWNFEKRKDLGRDLDHQPADNCVGSSNLVNVASLQLGKEGTHRSARTPGRL